MPIRNISVCSVCISGGLRGGRYTVYFCTRLYAYPSRYAVYENQGGWVRIFSDFEAVSRVWFLHNLQYINVTSWNFLNYHRRCVQSIHKVRLALTMLVTNYVANFFSFPCTSCHKQCNVWIKYWLQAAPSTVSFLLQCNKILLEWRQM